MKIIIIGMGNVGQHLASKLVQEGHQLLQCYNRSPLSTDTLEADWKNVLTDDWKQLRSDAELVILSVADDAIFETSKALPNSLQNNALVVHTSGFYGREILAPEIKQKGIFYPLNSFTKGSSIDWDYTPMFLTASEPYIQWLRTLAESFSKEIYEVDEKQKAILHIAAVMVNNFTNALFTMADDLLKENQMDLKPLLPLIETTFQKIKQMPPRKAQTGPAIRNDQETISKHIQLLKEHPLQKELYQLLTNYINPKASEHENR